MIADTPFVEFSAELELYGKQLPTKNKALKLVVTIPAKNESENIWKTLFALANQCSDKNSLPASVYEVLVLCNHCDDDTRDICYLFQEMHPEFPLYIYETNDPKINSVGAARKALMDLASPRLPDDGFIIMTDADTVADKYWLNAFLKTQNTPGDLICGIINLDLRRLNKNVRKQLYQTRQYLDMVTRLESELYPREYDPWPRHSYNSGPNMAIRKSVYREVGGMPPLACFEDIALYQKVISNGFKVKHSSKPVVTTSCRSSGRVPGGFGSQIKNWSESKTESVESLKKLNERFKAFAEIREYYQNPSANLLNSFCFRLRMQASDMQVLLQNHIRSSSLIIYLEQTLKYHIPWNSAYPDIPLEMAIEELVAYFYCFSQTTKSYNSCRSEFINLNKLE
ncbi:glycosyltransferase [Autumnicola musiva]|uniref:Glycosyltransferase n=1 Tax=Autumnicola musiva TaxID=3075589 RepID=A0ABU3D833_9FLAO|nr:glycosyltransferase [Zunongwangia sp. F117]MDT0677524.1 glycosyltransferase [Zunongwangia sp. F117]